MSDTETPTQVVQPNTIEQPQVQPTPPPPPQDWKGPEGAWYDLYTARQQAKQYREQLELARQQAEQVRTAATQAEDEARTWRTKYEQDTAILGRDDVPATFRHPRMVQRLWSEYEQYRDGAGEKAVPFRDWIVSDDVKSDPLYAAHFQPAAPAAIEPDATPPGAPPAGTTKPPPAPPAVHAPGTPARWTDEMIARARREGRIIAGRVNPDGTMVGGSQEWRDIMGEYALRSKERRA